MKGVNSTFYFSLKNPISILIGGGILIIIFGFIMNNGLAIGLGFLLALIGAAIYIDKKR